MDNYEVDSDGYYIVVFGELKTLDEQNFVTENNPEKMPSFITFKHDKDLKVPPQQEPELKLQLTSSKNPSDLVLEVEDKSIDAESKTTEDEVKEDNNITLFCRYEDKGKKCYTAEVDIQSSANELKQILSKNLNKKVKKITTPNMTIDGDVSLESFEDISNGAFIDIHF